MNADMPDKMDPQAILDQLHHLQQFTDLSILKLASPPADASSSRTSDASSRTSLDPPPPPSSPAALAADLAHYRELFAKLRFSYVEQVTKEKFIRSIVRDPPLMVSLPEILALEQANAQAKAQLKTRKVEVAEAVGALEARARELSRRYERVGADTTRLAALPGECAVLEARIAQLNEELGRTAGDGNGDGDGDGDRDLDERLLPLSETERRVEGFRVEQARLAREVEALRAKVPRRRREAEMLRAEMQPLEGKRQGSRAAAREARRRRDAALGGGADDLEHRARWYRASEAVLRRALDLPTGQHGED